MNIFYHLFAFIIGIVGFWLIIVYGSWLLALGVFLVIWGNNMNNLSQLMDIKKNIKNIKDNEWRHKKFGI